MSTSLIVILAVVAILFFWFIGIYNKLIRMIEAVRNNQKQIDIQLDRRFKVFESLINVVKKYMDYEKTTLKDVVALRSKANAAHQAGDEKTRVDLENQISSVAGQINVVFENYPDLKANQNVLQLQEEIVSTENKLSYAKQALNDSIERYTATKESFIEAMVVGACKKLDQVFVYWQLSEQKVQEHEDYTVKL